MAMDQTENDHHCEVQEKGLKSAIIVGPPPGIDPPGVDTEPAAAKETVAESAKTALQPVVVPGIPYGGAQGAGMCYAGAAYIGSKGAGRSHAKVPRRVDLAKEFTSQQDDSSSQITTVMIRNVPNQYHRGHLMQELDKVGFAGKYDFVHLPIDQQTKWNVGYAFVNFDSSKDCTRCMKEMAGHKFTKLHPGQQTRQALISVAHLQGLDKNLAHFRDKVVFSSGSGLLQPWVRPSSMPAQNKECQQDWDSCGNYWDTTPSFMWQYMMAYDQEYQRQLQLMASTMYQLPFDDQAALQGREEALKNLEGFGLDTDGLPDEAGKLQGKPDDSMKWIEDEVNQWLNDSDPQNTDGTAVRQSPLGAPPLVTPPWPRQEIRAAASTRAPEETSSAPASAMAQTQPAQGGQPSLGSGDWPELSVLKSSPTSRRKRGGR
eukprot:TRINITY_DN10597_c0_g1_i1.p1 TRINITY_DN10597_c0_g1~~TRINITY_DN10597_c0_g1_i1.p1  ORF type:complete len:430 (+),score=80.45 TRINITY_DN10597_c0_g1_i1:119-1408(+)